MDDSGTDGSGSEDTAGPRCGDGMVGVGEVCDDGNSLDDDGCDADCEASRVVEVAAGGHNTCVVTRSGGFRCWGGNPIAAAVGSLEAIGDDEPAFDAPVHRAGLPFDSIATSGRHACAATQAGELWCWGMASRGELGHAMGGACAPSCPGPGPCCIGDDESPFELPAVQVGFEVSSVFAATTRTCVVSQQGLARCWGICEWEDQPADGSCIGNGTSAVIGDDEHPASHTPLDLGGASIESISIGSAHTCAVTVDGAVACWGSCRDRSGTCLGLPVGEPLGDDEHPGSTAVLALPGEFAQVVSGHDFACGRTTLGTVYCWGRVSALAHPIDEPIGDNEPPDALGPVDLGQPVTMLAAGQDSVCAVLEDQTLRCWGQNHNGQLGLGHTESIGDDEAPSEVDAIDLGAPIEQIAAGTAHYCALLEDASLRCWGLGYLGALGYGNQESIGDNEHPAEAGAVPVFQPQGEEGG